MIEMNPRVSRSSALASKATGFPIAKIAALVAVGYTLDEIPNDITGETVAAFEPALDYVVVKIPRWSFEKFPGVDSTLGPQMKSVGETMALGRTFGEALQKAVQSLEIGADALDGSGPNAPCRTEFPICSRSPRPTRTASSPSTACAAWWPCRTGAGIRYRPLVPGCDGADRRDGGGICARRKGLCRARSFLLCCETQSGWGFPTRISTAC